MVVLRKLFGLVPLIGFTIAESTCEYKALSNEAQSLKNDIDSLNSYDTLISIVEECLVADKHKDYDDLIKLSYQLYYKNGLIQLSAGRYHKAVALFERALGGNTNTGDSYFLLIAKKLQQIYIDFGLWSNITSTTLPITEKIDPALKETYEERQRVYHDTLNRIKETFSKNKNEQHLEELFDSLTEISPYNREVIYMAIDYYNANIITNNRVDLTRVIKLKEKYETLLEVHSTSLTLNERLETHFKISVIQIFLLGQDPLIQGSSSHLRRCLNIDMDYGPCKDLIKLSSRLNKVNPDMRLVKDPEAYKNGHIIIEDWKNVVDFYINNKPSLKLFTLMKGAKFDTKTNYDLLKRLQFHLLSTLTGQQEQPEKLITMFFVNLDVILCQASSFLSKKDKKETSKMCLHALSSIGLETKEAYRESLSNGSPLPAETVIDLWNSYPHMLIYTMTNIVKKYGIKQRGSDNLVEQVSKFWNENNLRESKNPYVVNLNNLMEKVDKNKREQQFRQQQQQQQRFFQQQQQQQQRYQQQQASGLTDSQTAKNYYQILGIKPEASDKEIRKAYLSLTKSIIQISKVNNYQKRKKRRMTRRCQRLMKRMKY